MAITAAICNSFKNELLAMTPHTAADTYKIALFTSAATLDKTTTAYAATNEVSGTGYTAGGQALSGFAAGLSSDTAYLTFSNPSWANATITARGALIYNSSRSNKAVAVLYFGASDIVSTAGTFTVNFPAAGASSTITIT